MSPVALAPVRINPRLLIGRGERRTAENMVGRLFASHNRWRIEVAVGHTRKDRGIGDPQPLDANDPAFRADHAQWIINPSHPAGATGMIGAFGMLADERVELVVGLDMDA